MNSPCRQLLLPASEIFLGCASHAKAPRTGTTKDGSEDAMIKFAAEWILFLSYHETMLTTGGLQPSPATLGRVATQIALISNNSYSAGINDGISQATLTRADKPLTATPHKAEQRRRTVHRAILAACVQRHLAPVASHTVSVPIQ